MLRGLLELIFPPRCLLCSAPAVPFCSLCEAGLFHDPWDACPFCAAIVGPYAACAGCVTERWELDAALRLGVYDGVLREMVLKLKSSENEPLAERLGREWGERARKKFDLVRATCLIPVPLYWRRRWRRGYNQAEAVARGLSFALGVPVFSNRLVRVRNTHDQKSLGKMARIDNLREAFEARNVQGERVLLIDDVMTTGSTCRESARMLKNAGAEHVVAAVLARASEGADRT